MSPVIPLADMPELMTPEQVVTVLRKDPRWLAQQRYLRRGLPYHKVGQGVRYARADVEAYLAAGRIEHAH